MTSRLIFFSPHITHHTQVIKVIFGCDPILQHSPG